MAYPRTSRSAREPAAGAADEVYAPPSAEAASDGREPGGEEPAGRRFPLIHALGSVLFLALLSLVCWAYEVFAIKGWDGFAWIRRFPRAAIPVCLCVSFSVLVPVFRRWRVPAWRVATFVVSTAVLSLVSFEIARYWFLGRFHLGGPAPRDVVLLPFFSLLLAAGGFHVLLKRLVTHVRRSYVFLNLAALVLTLPLSYATIQIFPAVSHDHQLVHAIEMGYPMFWVNVLLAASTEVALWLTHRRSDLSPPIVD